MKDKELGLGRIRLKKNTKIYRFFLSLLAFTKRLRYRARRLNTILSKSKHPKTIKWSLVSLVPLSILAILALVYISPPNYHLSKGTSLIVGLTNKRMLGELQYISKTSEYVLNQSGITNAGSSLGSSLNIGGTKSSSAYSVVLPKDISKGITIYDDTSDLSFSMTPNISLAKGRDINGHIVYPGKNGLQAIYTLLGNGLKEDLVLNKPDGNKATYSYTLKLPSYLQARQNGSNAIGIYSADSALFGNISYGSSNSQAEVMNARLKSPKTNLVFELLPPVVNQSDGKYGGIASKAVTTLKLKGNTVVVSVTNLDNLNYPVSIDPSVLVSSASFTSGNNDGDISYTSGNLSEAGLDGGTISTGWNYTEGGINNGTTFVSGFTQPRFYQSAVAYNGYLYVLGGVINGSGSGDCTGNACNGVQYAAINSNGTIGTWAYTEGGINNGTTFVSGFTQARYLLSAVAYNGYMYVLGGETYSSSNDCTSYYYASYVCNGVQYAAINSNGTIGTWAYTSSFTQARESPSAAAYNGYLYVVGGVTDAGVGDCTNNFCNGVQYAAINSNGTIGTWAYTEGGINNGTTFVSGFNGTRGYFSAVVYNGYLYVIGGQGSGSDCTTYCNGVQFAVINSNGTIGTWAYTEGGINNGSTFVSGFTQARAYVSAVAYNGYLYIIGGESNSSANDCTGTGDDCNGVQYATINSNGTIGNWTYTTSFTQARSSQSAVSYNGYLYVMGGGSGTSGNDCTGTNDSCNGVQYGLIDPAGVVGTSSYTEGSTNNSTTYVSGFIQARGYGSTVAYNGYLYVLGGESGSSANDCTTAGDNCNGVQYAAINSNGTIGTWAYTEGSTNNGTTFVSGFTQARRLLSAVAYNGYLYVLGGQSGSSANDCTATGDYCNGVQYAAINSNGTIGTWAYTEGGVNNGTTFVSGFTQARAAQSAVVYNGYIYVMGGVSGTSANDCTNYCNGVQYAAINSNGTIGTWAYTEGGVNNGTTFVSGFTQARESLSSVVYNGYLYVMGGVGLFSGNDCTSTGNYCNGVQFAAINSNGTIGTWAYTEGSTNNGTAFVSGFTQARAAQSAVVYNGYLYVMGGVSGSSANDCTATGDYCNGVQYAAINSNGTIGTWAYTTSFTQARKFQSAVVYNGYIYVMGGVSGTSANDCTASSDYCSGVQYLQINNGGSGTIASWPSTSSLGTATYQSTSVAYNGYIYEIGGYNTTKVYYAPISSNGILGTWTLETGSSLLLTATYDAASVAYNGYIYELGGITAQAAGLSSEIEYAPINSNGSVGAWATNTNLPGTLEGLTTVAYNGYIYELGGMNSITLQRLTNVVEYAPINSNGTIGTWTATTSLPTGLYEATSVVYNNYLYEIGGNSSGSSNSLINTVDYAPINSNGTIGTWTATTSLPTATEEATSVAYNGYLYEIGGYTTAATASVYYAPINSSGTIGPWTPTTSLGTATDYSTSVAYNGYVYEIGGYTTAATAAVYYAGLDSIPRIGDYSILFDLSGSSSLDPSPTEIMSSGTNTGNPGLGGTAGPGNGGALVSYSLASNGCSTFTTPVTISTTTELNTAYLINNLVSNGCSTSSTNFRYVWVKYILDDSETASFPDIYGNHLTITGITLYYEPAQGNRLRGGATVTNGVQQSLYAPPYTGSP